MVRDGPVFERDEKEVIDNLFEVLSNLRISEGYREIEYILYGEIFHRMSPVISRVREDEENRYGRMEFDDKDVITYRINADEQVREWLANLKIVSEGVIDINKLIDIAINMTIDNSKVSIIGNEVIGDVKYIPISVSSNIPIILKKKSNALGIKIQTYFKLCLRNFLLDRARYLERIEKTIRKK